MNCRAIIISVLIGAAVQAHADYLLGYDFVGYAGNETQGTSIVAAVGIESPSFITRGTGLVAVINTDRFNAQGWSSLPTPDQALAAGDYFEFTIDQSPGYTMSITNIFIQVQRSAQGASNLVLRSSIDGYTTNLGQLVNFADSGSTIPLTVNLSLDSSFHNLTSPVTFRVVGYTGSSPGSMGFEGTGHDIQVYGTVVPEPTAGLLVLIGLGLLGYTRRERVFSA